MSDNRLFFQETVRRIIADRLTSAQIEAAERREIPGGLWTALADHGILSMLLPEEQGGVGADIGDAMSLLRELGAAAAPGPIMETVLGQALVSRAGLEPVHGSIALAFAADDAPVLYDVPWGGVADHVLVVSPSGIRLTHPGAWTVYEAADAAGEPRDTLADGHPGELVPADTRSALGDAAILRAGQMLGALEWTLRRSVEYASERKQFGREIAKFQTPQQMLAELAAHFLASAGIVAAAAESRSEALVAAARSRVADASDAAITIGHQIHGALGFSKEYALNYRTRRLMAWRDDFGSVQFWRRRLGASFRGCARDEFWARIADAGVPATGDAASTRPF